MRPRADGCTAGEEPDCTDGSLRPFRAALFFSFFNAMTWQVALGTPMVLFAERLGASAFAVGLAYSFVFLLTPVQVLSTALLPRFGYRRMMLSGWSLRSMFLLPGIALAWAAPETGADWMVVVFIGSVFFFSLFRAVGSCAYLPWLNSLVPGGVRGRYFASDQVCSGIGGVGTLLMGSLTLKILPLYVAFLLQYSMAFLGSWLSAVSLSRLRDGPRPSALSLREVLRATPRMLFSAGRFRQFVAVSVWTGLAMGAIPPFCAYYLRVGPGLSAAQIVLFTTVQYAGVIIGALVLRNRVDSWGARPFFLAAMAIYAGLAVAWLAILRDVLGGLSALYAIYFLLGVAASCWFSANMKYLPQVVEPERKALAFSIHGAATSLVSGISPVVWGFFIKGAAGHPSVDVNAFQVFFVVALVSAFGVALLVSRLPEETGSIGGWPAGGLAFRPFRALTYLASVAIPGEDRFEPPPTVRRAPDTRKD